ncbi:MAG TPA: hypothetical protein VKG25_09105, partial [Bryobacteraceae bacterium]|nr:hypothetical protein [Bryobacteraceae bacterium]
MADLKRYCITDSALVAARARNAEMIQIRAKALSGRELYSLVQRVLALTDKPVLVNTRLEFEGDLAVEAPQFDSEALRTCKEWWIEFPQQGL